jgi:hypothetical protein
MHRAYDETNAPIRVYWSSDRIEIQNPGGAFGQVNPQNFGTGITDYRNLHLAEAMRNLGYVQQRFLKKRTLNFQIQALQHDFYKNQEQTDLSN